MSAPAGVIGDVTDLAYAFEEAWAERFADAGKDLVVLEDVAAVLGDLGVPDAALAGTLLGLLQAVASAKLTFAAGDASQPQGSWLGRYVGR